jgi:hypothetical protein
LSNITDITDFGMAKAKLPEDKRSVKDQRGDDNGQDDARNKAQNGIRVWK